MTTALGDGKQFVFTAQGESVVECWHVERATEDGDVGYRAWMERMAQSR